MKYQYIGDNEFDIPASGKKAANLHLLKKMGFPIPPGFIIKPELQGFRELNTITDQLENEDYLKLAIEHIGGFPVAVRSSGHFEDSDSASFAGQYISYLNVNSLSELTDKIKLCQQQAYSDHLKKYSKDRGLLSADTSLMTVFIQKMVKAVRAGVSFTIHPLTGKEEESLHEVCSGLGENLVSGLITPTQYVYNFLDKKIVSSKLNTHASQESDSELTESELELITQFAWRASAYFKLPQDIEWAFDESGQFYFLQSRSITHIQMRTDVAEMTNADLRDGGVSSKVCTPLMYSLYAKAFDTSMQTYMTNIKLLESQNQFAWMHSYYGRVYWDASIVKKCLYKVPGFDEKSFDEDLGIQKNYGKEGPVRISSSNPRIILKAIPVALSLEKNFKSCLEMTEDFSKKYENIFSQWNQKINELNSIDKSLNEISNFYNEFMQDFFLWTECNYFTTIYNNSNLQTLVKDFVRGLDKKTGRRTQIEKLFGGLSDVSHLELQKDFIKLHSVALEAGLASQLWSSELKNFIAKNYFHSDSELDISIPRWEECPELIEKRIHSLIHGNNHLSDPTQASQKQYNEFLNEIKDVEKMIDIHYNKISAFFKKRKFQQMISLSRVYLSRREKMREYSTRAYYLVRKLILVTGNYLARKNILVDSEEIFLLKMNEILEILNGNNFSISKIANRKLIYDGFTNLIAPNEFGLGVIESDKRTTAMSGDHIYKGLACSSGITKARIRVLTSIDQMNELQPGEILITKFTDPSWTPVLGLIKGVITEVGGLLSHAAVISREYGIPAVLNVTGATQIFKTGQVVEMNGSTGEIQIQKENE